MSEAEVDAAILALRDYVLSGGRVTVRDSRELRPTKPGPATISFTVEDNQLYQWCWRRAAYQVQTGRRRPPGYG